MTKVTYPTGHNRIVDKETGELYLPWQRFFIDLWTRIGAGNNSGFSVSSTKNQVGIGTESPVTSAALEVVSTTGSVLFPRMTTTQRNALTAVNGMMIYNTTLNKFQGYENGSWTSLI